MKPRRLADADINELCLLKEPNEQYSMPRSMGHCRGCRRQLPWPAPRHQALAAPVACPECGKWYYAEYPGHAAASLGPTAHLRGLLPKHDLLEELTRQHAGSTGQLVAELLGKDTSFVERRREARYEITAPLVVVPVDGLGEPTGSAREATLNNLSANGAELTSATDITSRLLLLDLAATGIEGGQMMTQVRWRKLDCGMFRVGCEFFNAIETPLPVR